MNGHKQPDDQGRRSGAICVEDKWTPRRAIWFALAASSGLWLLIGLAAFFIRPLFGA